MKYSDIEVLYSEVATNKHLNDFSQHNVRIGGSTVSVAAGIHFNELARVANESIRTVINDAAMTRQVYSNIVKWTHKLERKNLLT